MATKKNVINLHFLADFKYMVCLWHCILLADIGMACWNGNSLRMFRETIYLEKTFQQKIVLTNSFYTRIKLSSLFIFYYANPISVY